MSTAGILGSYEREVKSTLEVEGNVANERLTAYSQRAHSSGLTLIIETLVVALYGKELVDPKYVPKIERPFLRQRGSRSGARRM